MSDFESGYGWGCCQEIETKMVGHVQHLNGSGLPKRLLNAGVGGIRGREREGGAIWIEDLNEKNLCRRRKALMVFKCLCHCCYIEIRC